jgi:hypothetical protein
VLESATPHEEKLLEEFERRREKGRRHLRVAATSPVTVDASGYDVGMRFLEAPSAASELRRGQN